MKLRLLLAAVAATLVGACVQDVTTAGRSETIKSTGTITEIDKEARRFVVRGNGKLTTLRANEQVRNFDQLEVGDRIDFEFTEKVAVGMADPSDSGELAGLAYGSVAEPGQRPGASAGGIATFVVDFLGYDPASNVATIRTADGAVEEVIVQPEMQAFARARSPGDRVVVAIQTALAVSVEPAG